MLQSKETQLEIFARSENGIGEAILPHDFGIVSEKPLNTMGGYGSGRGGWKNSTANYQSHGCAVQCREGLSSAGGSFGLGFANYQLLITKGWGFLVALPGIELGFEIAHFCDVGSSSTVVPSPAYR